MSEPKTDLSSRVVAVANGRLALQLALTGIHVEEPDQGDEAEDMLTGFLESDTGIVIVQEDLRDGFSDRFRDRLERHAGQPLILYCPSLVEEAGDVDRYVSEVIKPAVGYEIRLD